MENLALLKKRMIESSKNPAFKKFIEEETDIRIILLLYSRMVLSQVLKVHPSGCSPEKLREGCMRYCSKHYRDEIKKLEQWEPLFEHADNAELWNMPGVVVHKKVNWEEFLQIVDQVVREK